MVDKIQFEYVSKVFKIRDSDQRKGALKSLLLKMFNVLNAQLSICNYHWGKWSCSQCSNASKDAHIQTLRIDGRSAQKRQCH